MDDLAGLGLLQFWQAQLMLSLNRPSGSLRWSASCGAIHVDAIITFILIIQSELIPFLSGSDWNHFKRWNLVLLTLTVLRILGEVRPVAFATSLGSLWMRNLRQRPLLVRKFLSLIHNKYAVCALRRRGLYNKPVIGVLLLTEGLGALLLYQVACRAVDDDPVRHLWGPLLRGCV